MFSWIFDFKIKLWEPCAVLDTRVSLDVYLYVYVYVFVFVFVCTENVYLD